eukprot:6558100-Alexandrium_andersonii.AAC.1
MACGAATRRPSGSLCSRASWGARAAARCLSVLASCDGIGLQKARVGSSSFKRRARCRRPEVRWGLGP